MIINELQIAPYEYPFRRPFTTANDSLTSRRGFYVRLRSSDEYTGLGEAAPLPGFTRESYEDVRETLSALEDLFSRSPHSFRFKDGLPEENDILKSQLATNRFALESALLDIHAQAQNQSLSSLLSDSPALTISVNATVGQLKEPQVVQSVRQNIESGFKAIKLKIGRRNFEEDLDVVGSIAPHLANDIKLRLDVNQAWSYAEALTNMAKLADFPIEYIEQPVPSDDLTSLQKLREERILPIAADEAVDSMASIREIIDNRAADYLILKPSFLGIIPTIEAIKLAEQNEMRVVLTSGLDSIVGMSVACHLAAAFLPGVVHGLGTEGFLEYPWKGPIIPIINGRIQLPDVPGIGLPDFVRSEVISGG